MMTRLGLATATLLLVFTVADSGSAVAIVAGFAALTIAGSVALGYAAAAAQRHGSVSRVRSALRRQATLAEPAPQHPHTPGRRRSRAPSRMVPATV